MSKCPYCGKAVKLVPMQTSEGLPVPQDTLLENFRSNFPSHLRPFILSITEDPSPDMLQVNVAWLGDFWKPFKNIMSELGATWIPAGGDSHFKIMKERVLNSK